MLRWPKGRLEKLKPSPLPSDPQLAARSISETRSVTGLPASTASGAHTGPVDSLEKSLNSEASVRS